MMQVDVNVTRATLIPPRESLTPGMLNAVQLHFNFSDEWNGLEKVCVFSNEIETAPAVVENDTVSVPDTILGAVYRWISVGVTGEDGDGSVIIPTIWCRIGQVLPGAGGASSKFVTVDMLEDYWSKAEIDLQTEGDGTKFLGDDGQYHEVAQGGGDVTHQELEDGLALKADKTEVEALSSTVDDKADKSEIITVTSGDGTKFLADDGTYKPVSGGSDAVTHDELDAAVAPLATKSEVDAAVVPLATKDELTNATAGLATTTAMNAALALKADKTELNSYAKQYDVNQALDSKADKVATQTALDAKADKTELADYAKTTDVSATYATKTEVAGKADKSEIITVTTGTGTLFLADDGTYRPASGDPPDLTPYLKKDEASATYETQTHASATYATKSELPDVSDMLTKTEAASTYAEKSEIPDTSDMLTKTEAGTTYATKTELADKADASAVTALDTRVTATEGAITSLQTDKADASALSDYETTAHAEATYATKSELPDVSDMLTKTEAASTYAEKSEIPDTSDMLTKTEAAGTYATQTDLSTKADKTELEDYAEKSDIITVTTGDGTQFLADDGTYKRVQTDLSSYLTKTEAEQTYATQTQVNDKADKSEIITVTTGTGTLFLADDGTYRPASGDPPDLTPYLKKDEASATYATKSELPDVSDMLTKTEAESSYADKASLHALDTTVGSQAARINTLDANKADKTQIITVTTGSGTMFLADDGTYKPAAGDPPDLTPYLKKDEASATYETQTHASATYATKSELPDVSDMLTKTEAASTYAEKSEIPDTSDMLTKTEAGTTYATQAALADKADSSTVTALAGTVAANTAEIATLQTGKADKSELPDVSDMLTKTEAGTTYATKTELADKADASALADYETTAHAAATYETKADASQVKSITAAGFAVAPDSAGNVNVGGTDVSRVATSGSWGSEITYTIAQTLPAGATSDTKGSSLSVVKRTENSGANPRVTMTVDGVQLATSADIPDVSRFATTDYVQNTFESTAHASATYLKISDASATYATKTELADYETTAHASATYATKAELPDTSDMLTKTEAASTYETKADASQIKSIKSGTNSAVVDANGEAQVGVTTVTKTETINGSTGATGYKYVVQQTLPDGTTSDEFNVEYAVFPGTDERDYGSFYVCGRQTVSMPELTSKLQSYATKTEITDMATQTWVQQYIASLDGTNMSV